MRCSGALKPPIFEFHLPGTEISIWTCLCFSCSLWKETITTIRWGGSGRSLGQHLMVVCQVGYQGAENRLTDHLLEREKKSLDLRAQWGHSKGILMLSWESPRFIQIYPLSTRWPLSPSSLSRNLHSGHTEFLADPRVPYVCAVTQLGFLLPLPASLSWFLLILQSLPSASLL